MEYTHTHTRVNIAHAHINVHVTTNTLTIYHSVPPNPQQWKEINVSRSTQLCTNTHIIITNVAHSKSHGIYSPHWSKQNTIDPLPHICHMHACIYRAYTVPKCILMVYMYVCVYVCVYVCIYTCIHQHTACIQSLLPLFYLYPRFSFSVCSNMYLWMYSSWQPR